MFFDHLISRLLCDGLDMWFRGFGTDTGKMYCKPKICTRRGGGYSYVKAYRDVLPRWVTFSPKILTGGSHFTKIVNKLKNQPFLI